jgi:hypothetical protein
VTDEKSNRKKEVNYDYPLLVDGDCVSDCEKVVLPEEERIVLQLGISSADNHVTTQGNGYTVVGFIMSRTTSSEEFAQSEQATAGYSWYIRQAPRYGGKILAYFKDVRDALSAMETLGAWETDFMESDTALEDKVHDLDELRRLMVFEHLWKIESQQI